MFDLPLHMARDQIEESLRNKMASIKVEIFDIIKLFFVSYFEVLYLFNWLVLYF